MILGCQSKTLSSYEYFSTATRESTQQAVENDHLLWTLYDLWNDVHTVHRSAKIHQWPVDSLHKWPLMQKAFPCYDVIKHPLVVMQHTPWIYCLVIIPQPNEVGGGYTGFTLSVRLSVRLSVDDRFPEHKSSLLWNFNFKCHMHVDGGHRQKPIDFQRCHFQNGRLAAILEFFCFRTLTFFWLWISTSTSAAQYLCIWVGAYWFSATSFSKWPPGGHIRFFGFWTL